MNKFFIAFLFLTIISGLGFPHLSFGQVAQTAGGVDVDGSWYLGESLKAGDYFEYSLCELDLNDCAPITFKMWVKGDVTNVSEVVF